MSKCITTHGPDSLEQLYLPQGSCITLGAVFMCRVSEFGCICLGTGEKLILWDSGTCITWYIILICYMIDSGTCITEAHTLRYWWKPYRALYYLRATMYIHDVYIYVAYITYTQYYLWRKCKPHTYATNAENCATDSATNFSLTLSENLISRRDEFCDEFCTNFARFFFRPFRARHPSIFGPRKIHAPRYLFIHTLLSLLSL